MSLSNNFDRLEADCMNPPEDARTDAGVAGAGILLAFIITAALALLLSSFIVLSEIRGKTSHNVTRKILSGLSDQQIVEGIGIQIVGLARVNSMVPYHFFIIWLLAMLATATNFATLLALVQDFKRDWVLRWLRQLAMFVNLALMVVYGVFVLETNSERLSPTLPIACVWQEHASTDEAQGNQALSVVGTIAVIVITVVIFVTGTWYLHARKQRWGKPVRVVSVVLLTAIFVGATVRVVQVAQAFGNGPDFLQDMGEKRWSFGQLLAMLLLILPFISALELVRGEMDVPKANPWAESDRVPLTGGVNA